MSVREDFFRALQRSAAKGGKRRLFLSYSRDDAVTAERLYADLENRGFEPWMDREGLRAGERWQERIAAEIEDSDYVIALLSNNAITRRGYLQKELRMALEALDEFPPEDIFLIPVRLDDCLPQDRRLRELNWIDLFPSYEAGLAKLVKSLNAERPIRRNREEDERLRLYAEILRLVTKVHQASIKRSILLQEKGAYFTVAARKIERELEGDVETLMELRDRVDLISSPEVREAARQVVGFAVVCKLFSLVALAKGKGAQLEKEYETYLHEKRPAFVDAVRKELGLGANSEIEEALARDL